MGSKGYFNPKKKRKDPSIENEKRRLNNEAVKKSISSRVSPIRDSKATGNKK